jgi:uncharacterized protein (DUF1499 family)
MKKWLFRIGLVVLAVYVGLLLAVPRLSPRPEGLGVNNGQLKSCPGRPNCVSTQSTSDNAYEKRQAIALQTGETPEAAMQKLVAIVEKMPRTIIIEQKPDYLYVEFRTFAMRYIDDVEFYVDAQQNVIHYRSASRLGRSDLGVNGKRMDEIVATYNEQ